MTAPADRIAALRAEADRLEASTCTGISAQWCPVHGTCRCGDNLGLLGRGATLDDPNCPLHSPSSSHAEGDQP